MDDDKELKSVYTDCVSGKLMCGECKKGCADMMAQFLTNHQEKRECARKDLGKFLKG